MLWHRICELWFPIAMAVVVLYGAWQYPDYDMVAPIAMTATAIFMCWKYPTGVGGDPF